MKRNGKTQVQITCFEYQGNEQKKLNIENKNKSIVNDADLLFTWLIF